MYLVGYNTKTGGRLFLESYIGNQIVPPTTRSHINGYKIQYNLVFMNSIESCLDGIFCVKLFILLR